jgi:hypothetical protein
VPLQGQADKLIVGRIETRVDTMLEVGGGGNLNLLLLFGKHSAREGRVADSPQLGSHLKRFTYTKLQTEVNTLSIIALYR